MHPQSSLLSETSRVATPLYDFLVIIALEEEFNYFLSALNIEYQAESQNGITYYTFQIPAPHGGYAKGVVSFLGDMGIDDAHHLTDKLISLIKPGLVANIGISGIIDKRLKLGDVAVATEADDILYRSKVKQDDPKVDLSFEDLKFGGRSFRTTESLYIKLKNLKYNDKAAWNKWISLSIDEMNSRLDKKDISFLKEKDFITGRAEVYFDPVVSATWVGTSRQLKDILLARNRNFLAMDMESAGVVHAADSHPLRPLTIVLRGMSDLADERKEELDKINGRALRRWSMTNASRLFGLLIENLERTSYSKRILPSSTEDIDGLKEAAEKLHQTAINKYLELPYKDISSVRDHSYQDYSDLFSLISDSSFPTYRGKHLFETVAETIYSSKNVQPLRIEGVPGTGKTSFLSVLYWYFFDQYNQDEDSLLPVFISLHHYNEPLLQRDLSSPWQSQVAGTIKLDLEPLKDFIRRFPAQPLLIIIDGYDEFARYQDAVLSYLSELLKTVRHFKVIGSREELDSSNLDANEISYDAIHRLRPFEINKPLFDDLIRTFLKVSSWTANAAIAEPLKQTIKRIKVKTVDLFTLSLLLEHHRNHRAADSQTLAGILKSHCQRFLNRRLGAASGKSDSLNRVARIAFDFETKKEKNIGDADEDRAFWDLIQRHIRIRDYLIAHFITNELFKIAKGDISSAENLKYVYHFRVNRICKEIINQSPDTQLQVAKAIEIILKEENVHPYAKAQACYFAGRFDAPQPRAHEALKKLRISLKENERQGIQEKTNTFQLLLWRSLYVSLIYLGDATAQREYIEGLLSDSQKDDINRGFHLEYYGDQPYETSEELMNKDQLKEYSNTFDQLYANLKDEANDPLYEIEIHTLCSLAQHRHPLGRLLDNDRIRLIHLIDDLFLNHKIKTAPLRPYVRMVSKHLNKKDFQIGFVFDSYLNIKRTKRSGWVERGIKNGESVADHSYGAYLLALFLLPDTWEGEDYSKEAIMNMLLAHDLSEAITGDVLPDDKSEETDRQEREVYEEIKMLGTYDGLGRMGKVAELWEEFKGGTKFNARVAKDLDRLENLIQLWIYKAEGHAIKDFESWRKQILDAVETPPGVQVMEKLQAYYEKEIES
jgi:5'-deoxynucleotidase YfbR-like HD superfamily hydrolase/nucleoside phosphorylase